MVCPKSSLLGVVTNDVATPTSVSVARFGFGLELWCDNGLATICIPQSAIGLGTWNVKRLLTGMGVWLVPECD